MGTLLLVSACGRTDEAQTGTAEAPAAGPQSVPQSIPMGRTKSVTRFFVTRRGLGKGGDLGLVDAFHPQTILAYDMNDAPLPVPHGAPLRLRVERQLGYKMAKFLTRIEVVDRFDSIGRGHGGTWEDDGYEWYAGI